jgi:hypothetical protein
MRSQRYNECRDFCRESMSSLRQLPASWRIERQEVKLCRWRGLEYKS